MNRSLWWPIVISVSAVSSAVLTITGGALRPVVVSWFLLICPGMSVVRLLHIEDFVTELTLAFAFSIAMSTIIAETMVLGGTWSSDGGLFVLILISILCVSWQITEPKQVTGIVEREE